jgi:uncharacterized membrane protein
MREYKKKAKIKEGKAHEARKEPSKWNRNLLKKGYTNRIRKMQKVKIAFGALSIALTVTISSVSYF